MAASPVKWDAEDGAKRGDPEASGSRLLQSGGNWRSTGFVVTMTDRNALVRRCSAQGAIAIAVFTRSEVV